MFTLADTWLLNNRVNLKLLDQMSPEQFAYAANPRTRSIGDQFAHLHNVRVMWLEAVGKTTLERIAKGAGKDLVADGLKRSADAFASVLAEAETCGKLKGYKRGHVAFLGYLLAHDAHHRGQIVLHLKQANMPLDKTAALNLWEWEKI